MDSKARRLCLALVLASAVPAGAQELRTDPATFPGAEVTVTRDEQGETWEIWLPSGVAITESRRNGKISIVGGVDRSGHGAVFCAWEMYVAMAAWWDLCPQGYHDSLRLMLERAIDRTDDFIIANSLTPTTKADLIQRRLDRFDSVRGMELARHSDADIERECHQVAELFQTSPTATEKFETQLDDFLSVPRPPVMNPCL